MENVREREMHMQWYSEKTEKKIHTYIYIHTHTHACVCERLVWLFGRERCATAA